MLYHEHEHVYSTLVVLTDIVSITLNTAYYSAKGYLSKTVCVLGTTDSKRKRFKVIWYFYEFMF